LAKGAIAGYNSVSKNNAGLQSALNTVPVSITVDADNSWQLYRSGVLSQACGLFGQCDHAVIAVGYDTSASTFKIRNSWGASWGEGGYVRIANDVSNPYCLYNSAPFTAKVSADVTV
jgi:cathepsin L